MWRCHKLNRCFGKVTLGLLLVFASSIFLTICTNSSLAYAEGETESLTINLPSEVVLDIMPNQYNSVVAPITVSTEAPNGYTLIMQTSGETTNLTSRNGGSAFIPTITLPSGRSSIPSTQIQNAYAYSKDGVNFRPAPSVSGTGDIIADVEEVEISTTDTYNLTFGAKVDGAMTPGQYSRSFTFILIANVPDICDPDSICYSKNGSTDGGTMNNQTVSSNSSVTLNSPNFYRSGYGFAGWNTRKDGSGTDYGPNQTISVGDLSHRGIMLYAKWVQSTGNLQNWGSCDTMNVGDITALTDTRDGNVYTVAKLPDNACWMTENLRLDLSNPDLSITALNTNNPTTAFINTINQHPSSSSSFCTTNKSACIDQVLFNSSTVDENSVDYWPSYGVYYNWYTATAGNGTYSMSNPRDKASGDICPIGWSLPDGYGINGDYAVLDIALGGAGDNRTSTTMSNRWRSYPNNFLYSGQQNGNAITNRAETGNYQGISASSTNNLINMWLQSNKVSVNTNGSAKTRGESVRCMMQKYYTIHFDSNSSAEVDGIMYDQKAVVGRNVKLDANTFTISPQNGHVYKFVNWNTAADGSGTSYADGATVSSLAATAGETVTLYAQWEALSLIDVTIALQEGVTEVRLENSEYDSYYSVTESGDVVSLVETKPYTITVSLDSRYDFDGWSTTAGGTLGSTIISPTAYTVTSASTLTASASYRTTTLYLQNLNSTLCTTTPRTVFDNRDDEPYVIARLSDGNCWMLEDLRLGSSTLLAPLSDANTNMPEETTLTFEYPTRLYDYTVPEIDTSRAGQSVTNYGSGSGKAGVYYNFCSASAGTVCSDNSPQNATYDICPAGWRLPTGGSSGELQQLYAAYGRNVSSFNLGFSTALSGWYDANAVRYMDFNSAVVYWSSTASNNINKTYILKLTRNSILQNTGYLENNGFSIRCMLKSE